MYKLALSQCLNRLPLQWYPAHRVTNQVSIPVQDPAKRYRSPQYGPSECGLRPSSLARGSSLDFYCCVKSSIKSNTERKGSMWLTLPRSQPISEETRDRTLGRGHRGMALKWLILQGSLSLHFIQPSTLAQGGMGHSGLGPPMSIMNHENTPDLPIGLI